MYVYGGLAKYKTSANIYELDIATLEWKRIETQEPSPPPRSSHTAIFHQGVMVIYGGKNADGDMLGDLWELNLTEFTWTQHPISEGGPKVIQYIKVATIWPFNGRQR